MKVLYHIIGIWISIGGDLKVLCHPQYVLNSVAESGCVMGRGGKTLKRAPALCSGALVSKKGSERAPRVHFTMSSPLEGQPKGHFQGMFSNASAPTCQRRLMDY